MLVRWSLILMVALGPHLAASPAHAWQDWPGEWKPGRPALAQTVSATASLGRIEQPVFRLVIPHRTQKDGGRWQVSNCGPAALGMVLDGFGIVGQTTDDLRYRSHTYQGTVGMRTGTALQHIAQVAEDFGIPTFGLYGEGDRFRAWSLDDVREQLRLGRPVMPLVRLNLLPGNEEKLPRWNHYILLTGLTEDGFFYSDSLQTDPIVGSAGLIAASQLERAMRLSNIPDHALAFGGPNAPPLKVWMPDL